VAIPAQSLTRDTPVILSAPLPELDDDEAPRTDYNNPAKSTETDIDDGELRDDEAPRPFEGQRIKPTKANYPELARYFGGSPLNVIQKTFKATVGEWCSSMRIMISIGRMSISGRDR
jgi:hypothetical protein